MHLYLLACLVPLMIRFPAALTFIPKPLANKTNAQTVLQELLSGPLGEDNVLLFLDSGATEALDVDLLLSEERANAPVILLDDDDPNDFLQRTPQWFIRGSFATVVLVFTRSPTTLLEQLNDDWNPDFLVLFSLGHGLDTFTVLEDERIQRSKYLCLLEYVKPGRSTPRVFTSRPFRPTRTGFAFKSSLGEWQPSRFGRREDLFPERFMDFEGAVLHLGSWCDDFPFLYAPVDGGCVGSSLDLLDIIAAQLNFSYEVQMEPVDQNWGSKENGTWTGMLGDLVYHDKDLVINSLLLTEQPFIEFDSTYPYHMESYAFILEVPPPVPQWRGLLYPFTASLWASVLGTTAFVMFFLTLCFLIAPDTQDTSIVFLWVWAGVVRQSSLHHLTTSWSRLWMGVWWVSTLIITTGYTSNLVAFLTVPVYPKRIETVDQLASSGLRICMQDYGSFLPDALKVSADPSLRHLGENLDLFPYVYLSFEQGFDWVVEGTHALVETYSYLSYQQNLYNHTEHTYVMQENMFPGYYVWYMKKNCPYSSVISKLLMNLVEMGFTQRLYLRHMTSDRQRKQAGARTKSAGSPLRVAQLWGAFIVWAFGVLFSAVVFLAEGLVFRNRETYHRKHLQESYISTKDES